MSKNAKEIRLLALLLAVLLLYGFYVFLLSPKIAENRELENQITIEDTAIRGKAAAADAFSAKRELLEKHCSSARALAEQFYVSTEQEQYLDLLNALLKHSGMTFERIQTTESEQFFAEDGIFSGTTPYVAFLGSNAGSKGQDAAQIIYTLKDQKNIPVLDKMDITVEMTGKYSLVQKYLQAVSAEQKYIICRDLEIEILNDSVDSETRVRMGLTFVSLRELISAAAREKVPEELPAFRLPERFTSGSYRNLFAVENIRDAVDGMFKTQYR